MCEPLRGKKRYITTWDEGGGWWIDDAEDIHKQHSKNYPDNTDFEIVSVKDVKSAVEGFLQEVMEANLEGKKINILDLCKKWFEDVIEK